MAPRLVEGRHGLPETVDRPPIVTLDQVGKAKVLVRQRLQDTLSPGRGEREGPLAGSNGLVVCAHAAEMV